MFRFDAVITSREGQEGEAKRRRWILSVGFRRGLSKRIGFASDRTVPGTMWEVECAQDSVESMEERR